MKQLLPLIILMWMILPVIDADQAMETSGTNVNNSFIATACGGSTNCLIGDDLDDVAWFQMNSDGARMLSNMQDPLTLGTGVPGPLNCPQNTPYTTSCVPPRNLKPTAQQCGTFTRPGSGC